MGTHATKGLAGVRSQSLQPTLTCMYIRHIRKSKVSVQAQSLVLLSQGTCNTENTHMHLLSNLNSNTRNDLQSY